MLSWYKDFLIDLNAAKQLSSFNIWWQNFPQCWVSFEGLTPEGYWKPGSIISWQMMNLTKFTWSSLCYPALFSGHFCYRKTVVKTQSWATNFWNTTNTTFSRNSQYLDLFSNSNELLLINQNKCESRALLPTWISIARKLRLPFKTLISARRWRVLSLFFFFFAFNIF